MDEVKLADLNDVQDFFNRSHSTSVAGTFCTKQIDIKDFIKWCNDPCNNISENCSADDAYRLGQTICALEDLSDDKPKAAECILENLANPVISDTKMPLRDRTMKLLGTEGTELLSRLEYKPGKVAQKLEKELPENVAFYFALKFRLKEHPDERGYYHYQFDDSGNTIARVDPLEPFFDSTHDNLNQQWHVLISVLAYLDVAHALSSDQHEYHCLYPYLSRYDKGDLSEGKLQLKSNLSLNVIKGKDYTCEPMMTWIKDALVKQEGK